VLTPASAPRRPFSDLANTFLGRHGRADSKGGAEKPAANGRGPTTRAMTQQAQAASQVASEMLHHSLSHTLASRAQTNAAGAHAALPDIDAADRKNPQCVPEYVLDIMDYWRKVEPLYRPSPRYMQHEDSQGRKLQGEINERMRAILVDWLVEVHLKFKLMPETLFLTVNLIDRFLAKKSSTRKNLQLVGVAAMLIASKYEEIWAPEVKDFVFISDKAYSRDQILSMEKYMLNALKFKLTVPTTYHFLERYRKAGTFRYAGASAQKEKALAHTCQYLVELAQPDYASLQFKGSLLATAAVHCGLKMHGRDPWPEALAKHSGYPLEEVQKCAKHLAELHRKASKASLTAVHKKYSNPKYMEVAKEAPALI
jgi:cyclin B